MTTLTRARDELSGLAERIGEVRAVVEPRHEATLLARIDAVIAAYDEMYELVHTFPIPAADEDEEIEEVLRSYRADRSRREDAIEAADRAWTREMAELRRMLSDEYEWPEE